MNTILKDTTTNSFIEALELAYDLDSVEHPAERLSIRLGDNLIYGKHDSGAIVNKLDPNIVALLSAVAVDEKMPLELALEDEALNQPVNIQIDGFTVLSYCDGVYKEKLLLEQLHEDEKLKEAFVAVKDKAIAVASFNTNALVGVDGANSSDILIFEEHLGVNVLPVDEVYEVVPQQLVTNDVYNSAFTVEQSAWEVEATPETLRILEEELLKQSRSVFVVCDTQSEMQPNAEFEVETQPLPVQQQPLIQKVILVDDLQSDLNSTNVGKLGFDEQVVASEIAYEQQEEAPQTETSVAAVSSAGNIGINSGASRMFVAAAENNLITAIAETRDTDGNNAVDAASIDLVRAKDVNSQVDASLRDQQVHKLMTAIVAIGMASGKNEIKTKGGEYVVELGSDGSALLRSASGVIYDGLPDVKQASINLMSDLDINSLSRSVEHTAAYMREAEKEKEKQFEV